MAKLEHYREECIGCGACAAIHPDSWEMDDEGKSHLKNGVKTSSGGEEMVLTDEEDIKLHKEAAESCPVNCIHLTDERGKKII